MTFPSQDRSICCWTFRVISRAEAPGVTSVVSLGVGGGANT